jgi:DNA helicase HerA-like ATPase
MLKLSNPYLKLLKMDGLTSKTELFNAPTASLDVFLDGKKVDIDNILKKSLNIMGKAGSGKSNGAGRVIEQLMKNKMQIFLEDLTGEHMGIVEMFKDDFIVLELPADGVVHAKEFLASSKSIYLDCSKYDRAVYMEFIEGFLREVFYLKVKMPPAERKPQMFIFEESHNFIPESINLSDQSAKIAPKIKEHLRKFSLEGRKYGCPCIFISQRPALNDKSIISQSRLGIYLQVTLPNDVKLYHDLIPGSVMKEIRQALMGMKVGDCYYILDGHTPMKRHFKRKDSVDIADTPGFAQALGWKSGQGLGLSPT